MIVYCSGEGLYNDTSEYERYAYSRGNCTPYGDFYNGGSENYFSGWWGKGRGDGDSVYKGGHISICGDRGAGWGQVGGSYEKV